MSGRVRRAVSERHRPRASARPAARSGWIQCRGLHLITSIPLWQATLTTRCSTFPAACRPPSARAPRWARWARGSTKGDSPSADGAYEPRAMHQSALQHGMPDPWCTPSPLAQVKRAAQATQGGPSPGGQREQAQVSRDKLGKKQFLPESVTAQHPNLTAPCSAARALRHARGSGRRRRARRRRCVLMHVGDWPTASSRNKCRGQSGCCN